MVSNDTFNRIFSANAKPHDVSPKALEVHNPDVNAYLIALGKALDVKPTTIKAARKTNPKTKTAKGKKAA